jgi:ATP-dependent Clp protease ATP-binding subunit ClpA
MMCYRCKKRPATVFITTNKDPEGASPKGLCLVCAKELGIKPVNDIIKRMGITEEEIDDMLEQLSSFTEGDMSPFDDEYIEADAEVPVEKSIPSFSSFFKSFFPGSKKTSKEKKQTGTNTSSKPKKRKYLDHYCTNLTEKAKNGKLDRVIGRVREIDRITQILSRRTKNNPCLVGEPGVGKTAIAEGLAIKISEGKVPYRLKNKEIYLLDLTALVAGTQFRGQFESRIKGLVEEVKSFGNIILFIDEVHNLVGSTDINSGSMNTANILKPALSRGEIQVIGATTFTEYRKYIEKDPALERRFQTVQIDEPSVKQTIDLLKGVKDYYETFHRVHISEELLKKIVILAKRYIMDRFFPDKAIDLLDEACARASIRNKALAIFDGLSDSITSLKNLQDKLQSPDIEKVDYEELAKVKSDLDRLTKEKENISQKALGADVTEDDIANVIQLWTGIPANKVKESERAKLKNIEKNIKEKIVGQDEAVKLVSAATKRNRLKLTKERRPASFIFVGPTGVGKTELAKVLCEELFDTRDSLIRVDMSEYMEKHSVSKMTGAPPGYVGYDENEGLTEKVRRKPYSVILFDEIEKAHPDIMNILLQILDDGMLTDSKGRKINFENTIIVMTSNAGSNENCGSVGFGKDENTLTKDKAQKALKEFLRPEFLGRIDEIVVFNNLKEESLKGIAKIMLNDYSISLEEQDIKLSYDEDIIEWLAKKSKDSKIGARKLRNLIRKEIEDNLTNKLIDADGEVIKNVHLAVEEKNEDSKSKRILVKAS